MSSDEYEYSLYTLSPYGYAIIHNDTNSLMEACYSPDVISPVNIMSTDVYYYGGPFVYCTFANGIYTNVFSDTVLTKSDVNQITNIESFAKTQQINSLNKLSYDSSFDASLRSNSVTYSVEYDYFKNLTDLGDNENGTCTIIAATILFGYYDNFVNDQFVDTQYESGNGTTESFHQLINNYVYGNSDQDGIFIRDALAGFNAYLSTQNVCATMYSEYSSPSTARNQIILSLQNDQPVAASMGKLYGAAYNHSVVIYSATIDSTGTTTFTMHMGWYESSTMYREFVANANWFYECGYITFSHNYQDYQSSSSVYHTHQCSICDFIEEQPHTFGNWTNSTSAYHTRNCINCSYYENDAHTMGDWMCTATHHIRKCTECTFSEKAIHKFTGETLEGPFCYICGYISDSSSMKRLRSLWNLSTNS